ncbi:hypothetical protein [Nostoc foliaceum]|uniref:Uncharacterized protein n=1 Tax=Nostoc linckia FACHB-391 TaxID=2692906 RepID=A0ABR8F411_NOSLI|nr:hypothetical protein [Nostoc foliaceum]MBD2564882.1 hypothetical protein [Nostoc linckia FACHB-391]
MTVNRHQSRVNGGAAIPDTSCSHSVEKKWASRRLGERKLNWLLVYCCLR